MRITAFVYSTVNGEIMGYIGAPWSAPSRFSGDNLAPQCSWHLIKRLVNLLVATWRSNIMAPLHLFSGIIYGSNLVLWIIRLLPQRRLQRNAREILTEHCRIHLWDYTSIVIYIYGPKGVRRTLPLSLIFHFFSPSFLYFSGLSYYSKLWFELYLDNIHFTLLLLKYSNIHFYYFIIE